MLAYSTLFICLIRLRCNEHHSLRQSLYCKRAFNINAESITEYFSVLASDGKSDCGTLHNENLLFKDNFLQHIATSRRFLELIITAKRRAQMEKTTVLKVIIFIDAADKLERQSP